jgi:2-dehydropantoate 2-reductase
VRICIVGCGAIGSLLAARVTGAEVWGYDVAPIDRLLVDGASVDIAVRRDANEIPRCDVGLVATKATQTEAAIETTKHLFDVACSVQNGIGSEEVLARHVPRVIRGVTMIAGHVIAPGEVVLDADGPTWLGPFEPKPASREEIDALAGAIGAHALEDARGAQWTKLLFNASTNPLAALTRLTHGELCDVPALRAQITALVNEGRAVADALGITLPSDPDELISRAAHDNHRHKPSMLQDALARRATEIAALNGGIVREGAAVGVPTPLHAAITALIIGMETGYAQGD